MKNPWKTLSSKQVFDNGHFKVREDRVIRPDGQEGSYGVVEIKPTVMTVVLDKDQKTRLVGLYRYTNGNYSWELPAGGCEDEDLLSAAKRELQEETGLTAKDWREIGTFYPSNGMTNEFSHIFLAQDLSQLESDKRDEEGIKEIKILSLEEALEMVKDGRIQDAQTMISLIKAAFYLGYDLLK